MACRSTSSVAIALPPTVGTRLIAQAAIKLLRGLYRPGFAYQKTDILLTDLISIHHRQPDLFEDTASLARSQSLMTAVDSINRMVGRGTVKLLAEGTDQRSVNAPAPPQRRHDAAPPCRGAAPLS